MNERDDLELKRLVMPILGRMRQKDHTVGRQPELQSEFRVSLDYSVETISRQKNQGSGVGKKVMVMKLPANLACISWTVHVSYFLLSSRLQTPGALQLCTMSSIVFQNPTSFLGHAGFFSDTYIYNVYNLHTYKK